MRKLPILLFLLFCSVMGFAQHRFFATSNYTVSTLAGDTARGDSGGYRNGANDTALFNAPAGIAVDTNGNVYVADAYNNRIRKIAGGMTSILAGDTAGFRDGSGTVALFNQPLGICTDRTGNIYVADTYNNAIRKISPAGMVTTIGGKGIDSAGYRNGHADSALFNLPTGVAIDTSSNIYVADNGNNVIRMITASGIVSTLAGNDTIGYRNGLNASAEFFGLGGIATDNSGNVYVAEYGNNSVRKISKGYVTNIAGYDTVGMDTLILSNYPGYANNDTANKTRFNNPTGIVVDGLGNVFVSDEYNNVIREISKDTVFTFAGTRLANPGYMNGNDTAAQFYDPIGIALDKKGNFYVADNGNNVIREITPPPPLGIEPIASKEVKMLVYPNPCNNKTYIASAPTGIAELLDMTGRAVWANEHFKAPYTLSTDNISPGVYFLRINNATQSAVTKIVVAH
jgi:serine/threonine-protein kinase